MLDANIHAEEELGYSMGDADASIGVDMLMHGHVEDEDYTQGESSIDKELVVASTDAVKRDIDPDLTTMQFDPPRPPRQDTSIPFSALGDILHERAVNRNCLAVIVPPAKNRWEYKIFKEDDEVNEILEEYDDAGFIEYLVLFSDGSEDVVSLCFPLPILQHMLPLLLLPPPSVFMLCLLLHQCDSFYINTCIVRCNHLVLCNVPFTKAISCYYSTHPSTDFPPNILQRTSSRPSFHRQIQPPFHRKRSMRVTSLIEYSASTDIIR